MLAGLILDDLRDSAHGAFLNAIPAGDAGILIHGLSRTIHYLENLLGACVNADAAADALVSFDYWM